MSRIQVLSSVILTVNISLEGNALKDVDVPIDHVYASPSLRCIQTATGIVQGLGLQRPIHVEPGLFEWLGWYKSGLPVFMEHSELQAAGFNIDTSYEPVFPVSRYNRDEDIDGYYDRCHQTTKAILQRHEHEGRSNASHHITLSSCFKTNFSFPSIALLPSQSRIFRPYTK